MKQQQEYDLGTGFTYLVDTSDENQWDSIISLFKDATINQTWAYCNIRSSRTSNIILKQEGRLVAAAMLRLKVIPVVKRGIAYLGLGPMWKLRNEMDKLEYLRMILRALKAEYVVRRALFLRISPNMFTTLPNHGDICRVFEGEGFRLEHSGGYTLFLDLAPSCDELRKGFHQKWRNCLNRAEKTALTVHSGTNDELFMAFRVIYEEMLDRKRYETTIDIDQYAAIQRQLPSIHKPLIVISELDGHPMAGGVFSINGETGMYLLGATSNEGIKNGASYIVQWHIIKLLKKRGFRTYDLGGCSPKRVPTTYHFKAGVCGKKPELFSRIGIMETCDSLTSCFLVRSGEILKSLRRRVKR